MYTWVVEIWSPMREAGIEKYQYIDWFRDHPIDDDLKLYRMEPRQARRRRARRLEAVRPPAARRRSRSAAGTASMHSRNPPPALLERELARFPKWMLWQALTSPKMELVVAEADALGDDSWRVRLVVQNTGLAAELRVEARAGAQGRARRRRRDRAAGGRDAAARQAPRGAGPARRQGVQAHRRLVLARLQHHRRRASRSNGSCAPRRASASISSRGTRRPASCARASTLG